MVSIRLLRRRPIPEAPACASREPPLQGPTLAVIPVPGRAPRVRRPNVSPPVNPLAVRSNPLKKLKRAMGGSCKDLAWMRRRRRVCLAPAPELGRPRL